MRRAAFLLIAILAGVGFAAPPSADKVAAGDGKGRSERPHKEFLFVSGAPIRVATQDSSTEEIVEVQLEGKDSYEQSVVLSRGSKGHRRTMHLRRGQHGVGTIRFLDAKDRRVRRELRARILPPAGSPETGPVLNASKKWDRSLLAETGRGSGRAMRRSGMLSSMFRLSKAAQGGSVCLADYSQLVRSAQEAVESWGGVDNANPLLLARIHFHYQLPQDTGVSAGQFHRLALFRDSIPNNRMKLLFSDDYIMSNSEDRIMGLDVVHGGKSTRLAVGKDLEMIFPKPGMNEFAIRILYASGEVSQQRVAVHVGSVLTAQANMENDQLRSAEIAVLPVNVIFSEPKESPMEGDGQ